MLRVTNIRASIDVKKENSEIMCRGFGNGLLLNSRYRLRFRMGLLVKWNGEIDLIYLYFWKW